MTSVCKLKARTWQLYFAFLFSNGEKYSTWMTSPSTQSAVGHMPSWFTPTSQGTDTTEVLIDRRKTHCAHYTGKAFTSHSRGLWGGNRRGTCTICKVFCSCHELQWVSQSSIWTSLFAKKNDQEPHFFSYKYVFNRGKVTFQSLLLSLKKKKIIHQITIKQLTTGKRFWLEQTLFCSLIWQHLLLKHTRIHLSSFHKMQAI